MLSSYMQQPCDYLDDYGHLDLSRWQDRFEDCHALAEGDRIMNCVNMRQPFVKMRTPPKFYPGGALPPDDYVPTTTSRTSIGGQTTHSFATHMVHGIRMSDAPSLPRSFDIRKRWPKCKGVVNTVLEQQCNNCWAYSTSGVMSDRTCIASGGRVKARLSPDDLTTCCITCEAV
ncbi:cathepsin B1, partial [Aphelenchoides avenae]